MADLKRMFETIGLYEVQIGELRKGHSPWGFFQKQ